jgi:regulator of sirC expression with transglutaminase-like and TPR domain
MYVPKCFQTNITKEELIEKMKNKETLEEAAERIISDMGWAWENTESSARMVARHCAKLQDEFYSEEEVEVLIKTTYEETMRAMVDWFINNKDKNQEEMESAIKNYVYPRLAEKGIKFKNK